MDLTDDSVRYAMRYLTQLSDHAKDDSWLGDSCNPRSGFSADEEYVLTRNLGFDEAAFLHSVHNNVAAPDSRRYKFVFRGDAGWTARWVWRNDGLMTKSPDREFRTLSTAEVRHLQEALAGAAFEQTPLEGTFGMCHAEITALESCRRGRFHAVLRMCSDDAKPMYLLADSLEAILRPGPWRPVAFGSKTAR